MSKASEWAKLEEQMQLQISQARIAKAESPGVVLISFGIAGEIAEQIAYSPDEALVLARWILDIFGEKETP